ncbi:MAG: hypothetical protein JRH07_08930 [Deltaproteobacteria bacterium]|nr:hypothetical protein [Deltaproteobacteria bacterium]
MASVRLDITSDMGKAEEIAVLKKLAAAVERAGDTYLSSLFRRELVDWVVLKIQDDLLPDMWALYRDACEDMDAMIERHKEAVQEIEGRTSSVIWRLKRSARRMAKRILAMKAERERLWKSVDEYRADLREAQDLASEEHDRSVRLEEELAAVRSERSEAEGEVLRLKARIYDLIEKYEGGPEPEIEEPFLTPTSEVT